MAGREPFDGRRQKAVLEKLQFWAGIDDTEAAHRIRFSYPQARRYFGGETPVRPDQYERFAQAYGVLVEDLAAELAGVDVYPDLRNVSPADQPTAWTFRSALRGHLPEHLIERYAPTYEGRPLINQMAAVEAFKQMAAEIRDENTPDHLRAG